MMNTRGPAPRRSSARPRRLLAVVASFTPEEMAVRARRGGVIGGISAALAMPGCLDNNPEFEEPPVPTSGASDGASSTASPTTGTSTTGTPATGTTTGSAMTSSDTDETTATVSSSTDPITTGMTTGPQPVCGDGNVEGDEECDNGFGNADDADCTLACKNSVCGDGLVNISEEMCDDAGNADPSDGCISCLTPASCADVLSLAPMAPSGPYFVDVDGLGLTPAIPVYCDMDLAGGGWTLIERSPSDDPIGVALYQESPVNMGDPMNARFRLPKMIISTLSAVSSEAWLGCGGGDHLLFSPFELFKGEFAPQDCYTNVDKVLYKEAELKGFKLMNVELCTGFMGLNDGECPGAWRVNELDQEGCGLLPYPWDFMVPVTSQGAEAFATDAQGVDTLNPIHDCHKPGAVRVIMVR